MCMRIVHNLPGLNTLRTSFHQQFFAALFGIVVKLEPEQCIDAVTVPAHQSSGMGPEKAVGRIALEVDALAFGMRTWIPLVDIVACGARNLSDVDRLPRRPVKKWKMARLAFEVSSQVDDMVPRMGGDLGYLILGPAVL